VGVNFIGAGSSVPANLSTGFWGQTNWNNVPGKEGDVIPLVDSNGAPSGISLIFRGSSTGNTAGLGTNPLNSAPDYSRFTNLGAATGPQDGAADLWSGSLRHQNSFSFDPEPLTITLSGLSEKFSSYDIFLYFGNPGDQGDHYLVEFDADADNFTADPWNGTTSEVTQAPVSSRPLPEGQAGGNGGRSTGRSYGYNDNGTLMGGALSTNIMWAGPVPNDSFAVSSDYISNGEHLFSADECRYASGMPTTTPTAAAPSMVMGWTTTGAAQTLAQPRTGDRAPMPASSAFRSWAHPPRRCQRT